MVLVSSVVRVPSGWHDRLGTLQKEVGEPRGEGTGVCLPRGASDVSVLPTFAPALRSQLWPRPVCTVTRC